MALFLFAAILFIRLPFFFRDYMDQDESTFILIGQSVADGYLPYDRLWDLKPPLLFYIFGLVEYIFPHSLVAIRVFGSLIIFGSAILLILIAKTGRLRNAALIALAYVILSSMFGSVQGVMSEHIAVFFMLSALFFYLKKKTHGNLFLFGFLSGCAVMCKMNYAYAIPIVLFYYFITNIKAEGFWALSKKIFIAVAGLAVSCSLISMPYIIAGKLNLFIDSVFIASFEYGQASDMTVIQKLKKSWWIILMGISLSILAWKKASAEQKQTAAACSLILLTTIYTFFSSGKVNGHYLIQVYPFIVLIILGILVSKSLQPALSLLVVIVLLISVETWIEYYRLGKHVKQYSRLYNGKSVIAIEELKKRNLHDKRIFFSDYHIGYWSLKQYPLTKSTTHPSTLRRPLFFKYFDNPRQTSMAELRYLFEDVKPDVIVSKNRHLSFFPEGGEENQYFETIKSSTYQMIYENDTERIYIWQRR
jgi:4-amino-4-deoxy-L-arabinose transferase-like glycosyltransferase